MRPGGLRSYGIAGFHLIVAHGKKQVVGRLVLGEKFPWWQRFVSLAGNHAVDCGGRHFPHCIFGLQLIGRLQFAAWGLF